MTSEEKEVFYVTCGENRVSVEIPNREDDLSITNEWLDLVRRVVNRRGMEKIHARRTAETKAAAITQGVNPS